MDTKDHLLAQDANSIEKQDSQTSKGSVKNKALIIILTIAVILGIVGSGIGCWLVIAKNNENASLKVENASLKAELTKKEEQLGAIEDNKITYTDTNLSGIDGGSISEPDGMYWNLDKIGMRIPITQELADNITLVEIDNGYSLALNLIVKYRAEGYCGNGGSSAFGRITKTEVSRGSVQDDPTLYSFVNNVIYPKTYIAYDWYGESTMCWDLGEGGEARHDEVEQVVQNLQEPLAQAIQKIEPIQ